MAHVQDWLPLLHLFYPKTFYRLQGDTTGQAELPQGIGQASTAREASTMLRDELVIEKLAGGNSNFVYRLSHEMFPQQVILLRVYGGGDNEAIDRYRDILAMRQMSDAELSPSILHTFRWGRVEEFMDDVATCTTDMLLASPTLLTDVYRVIKEMHQLRSDHFLPELVHRHQLVHSLTPSNHQGDPNEYYRVNAPKLQKVLESKHEPIGYYKDSLDIKLMESLCPSSFERVTMRYLRLTCNNVVPEYRDIFAKFYGEELVRVRGWCEAGNIPLVFSHNDINPGNVLLSWRKVPPQFRKKDYHDVATTFREPLVTSSQSSALQRKYMSEKGDHVNLVEAKGVVLIDFEYSDVNYRCFDLGNTICELDYDYTKGNGSGEPGFIKYMQTNPPASHCAAWSALPPEYPRLPELIYDTWERQSLDDADPIGALCLRAVHEYFDGSAADAPATITREQLRETFLGMLCSHFHWSLWSFVLACNSDDCTSNAESEDDFASGSSGLDYIFYGNTRIKEYFALREWLRAKGFIS
ncbi:ethanolamine kinase [Strigomonas culicis]|nr:ethanolamine kinase [Strigomonas culicis]|eukprot:EPY20685.1 ethanolamine kinase [Strigomonas culicis]